MRRSELALERQKANLAEPFASKSWLRRMDKNSVVFAKTLVVQEYPPFVAG
jgi:hypothetical protein